MPKCPFCGSTKENNTSKEWDYAIFHVKEFTCLNCLIGFRAYYKGKKLSHTIPKVVSNPKKVLFFLRHHEEVSTKQIATTLKMKEQEVEEILLNLQKIGRVFPVSKT